MKIPNRWIAALLLTLLSAAHAMGQNSHIALSVDAKDAPRQILHATLKFPVSTGPLTLLYPKWIPGNHGPTGPVADLVNLTFKINGQPIQWRRDPEEMYAFHIEVPTGANQLEASFDFILPPGPGASSTAHLLVLSWNNMLLYPKGPKASALQYAASLRLPDGWKHGTALSTSRVTSEQIDFTPVSLETLVDSPVTAGKYFKTVELSANETPAHWLHIAADSESALQLKEEAKASFSRLVKEARHLFGVPHYRQYHFLVTLSDHIAHFGLEHHESSDNRLREKYLIDDVEWKLPAYLLPHELVHSWNGKYRRPSGLATPDFHQPMKSELLWVYEGLTDYLGEILTVRSGLWTNSTFHEALALTAAMLDYQAGRKWRPLADTTTAAHLLYGARPAGSIRRRSLDYYPEGDLIWLEADILIRQQSHNRYSLDDFCRKFFGGEPNGPEVVPYEYNDLIRVLNEIVPYDWNDFFQKRVYAVNPRAPLGGIEGSGWVLSYTNTIPELLKLREGARKVIHLNYSIGLLMKDDGTIIDVVPESPADKGGIVPNSKLVAVDGLRWNPGRLRTAIQAAQTNQAPLELLIESNEQFKTQKLHYQGGEKYPALLRDTAQPDLLKEILSPRSTQSAPNQNP
jgi:predicted metalloprotease with PDZ domain